MGFFPAHWYEIHWNKDTVIENGLSIKFTKYNLILQL